jgi:hypothetical protein
MLGAYVLTAAIIFNLYVTISFENMAKLVAPNKILHPYKRT